MERRLWDLWEQIPEDEYITSNILSGKLFLSEKTIRQDVKRLNDCLVEYGAAVESKHGYGFHLVVHNREKYKEFLNQQKNQKGTATPVNVEERIEFILAYLLFHEDYVQIEELCELLYISDSTLQKDLRNVKQRLAVYDVQLVSRAKHGMRVEGTEFNLRSCITNYVMKRGILAEDSLQIAEQEKYRISEILRRVFQRQEMSIPELSFQNLILHMYTTMKRLKKGYGISFPEEVKDSQVLDSKNYQVAKAICEEIEKEFQVAFNEDEIIFITIHISGKRITSIYEGGKPNLVISEEIFGMVETMLKSVYEMLKVDLRNDFAVKMALAKHMVSLEIRLKYHMALKNPLIEDIRKNYSYAYTIAVQAVVPIEQKHNKRLSEDEIGYIALIFELAIQESKLIKDQVRRKKNILVVCATGKTSAELLAWQYRNAFGQYLDRVEVCNIGDLPDYPMKEIDYIFTTMPIGISVSRPIMEVKMFLDDNEISQLRKKLQNTSDEALRQFYRPEFFFTGVTFKSKEDVIEYMCAEICKYEQLPEGFAASVLQRESMGATDFGEKTAFPHSFGIVSEHNFAAVCVLDKPVFWSRQKVSIVILMAISSKHEGNLQDFYEKTSEFMMDKEKIKYVIQDRTFEGFVKTVSERANGTNV